MPASLIFCLARTRRCAIASSLTRRARATCAVDSPQTVRSVSATWTSGANAGWQQVKISRSMSSSSIAGGSAGACAFSSRSGPSACSLPRKTAWRLIRSIALCLATLTSQARVLSGTSHAGQRANATAKASWSASSARSKSPTRRISVASARPASSRKILSISDNVICRCAAALSLVVDPDRPHLDRADARRRNPRRDLDRGIEILGLHEVIAAELLARFGKRAVGLQRLALALAYGRRGRGRLQPVARLEIAALDDALREGLIFRRHPLPGRRTHIRVLGFVLVDHQQILHRLTPVARLDRRHPVERDTHPTTSSG